MDLIIDNNTEIFNINISSYLNHTIDKMYNFKDVPYNVKQNYKKTDFTQDKKLRLRENFCRMGLYILFNQDHCYNDIYNIYDNSHEYDVILPYIENEIDFNIIKQKKLIKFGIFSKLFTKKNINIEIKEIEYIDYTKIFKFLVDNDYILIHYIEDDERDNIQHDSAIYNCNIYFEYRNIFNNIPRIVNIQDTIMESIVNLFSNIKFIKLCKKKYNKDDYTYDSSSEICYDYDTNYCNYYNIILYTDTKYTNNEKIEIYKPYKINNLNKLTLFKYKVFFHDDNFIVIQKIHETIPILWEDIIEGYKVLVDNNNIYSFNVARPVFLGTKDINFKLTAQHLKIIQKTLSNDIQQPVVINKIQKTRQQTRLQLTRLQQPVVINKIQQTRQQTRLQLTRLQQPFVINDIQQIKL